jgi:transposase-like protein
MVDVDLSGGLGAGPRRRRSADERRRVVEETLEAGASVARVALKHGVNANQVFQWRRLYRDGKLGVKDLQVVSAIEGAQAIAPAERPAPAKIRGSTREDAFVAQMLLLVT